MKLPFLTVYRSLTTHWIPQISFNNLKSTTSTHQVSLFRCCSKCNKFVHMTLIKYNRSVKYRRDCTLIRMSCNKKKKIMSFFFFVTVGPLWKHHTHPHTRIFTLDSENPEIHFPKLQWARFNSSPGALCLTPLAYGLWLIAWPILQNTIRKQF